MNTRTMYVLAFSVYLAFVVALIVLMFFFNGDEGTQLMGMYALSSGLMVCTLILAVVFMRDKSSERYRELYMEGNEVWEKKD